MNLDDLLMAIILAGIALSVAYLRAEFTGHRRYKTNEERKEACLRKLYDRAVLSSHPEEAPTQTNIVGKPAKTIEEIRNHRQLRIPQRRLRITSAQFMPLLTRRRPALPMANLTSSKRTGQHECSNE